MEEILQFSFNTSLQGLAFVEPVCTTSGEITDFRYRLVNKAFAHITRHTVEDLIAKLVSEVFPPEQTRRAFQQLETILRTGQPQQWYEHFLFKEEEIWLHLSLSLFKDLIMVEIQDITEQKESEKELQRRLSIESLVSAISGRLITLDGAELDAYITDALRQISLFNDADRAAIFKYSSDYQWGSCTHEWCAPGFTSSSYKLQNLPLKAFFWLYNQLKNSKFIQFNTNELPVEAINEKTLFDSISIRSMIAVPLIQDEKILGFIGFNAIGRSKVWDNNDVFMLQTFSTLVVNAQQRQQQEAAIRRVNQRLNGLHAIDQALLNHRTAGSSPMLTALQHMNALVPCDRLTIFRIDEATGLATAECQLAEGELIANPDLVLSSQYFYNQFKRNSPIQSLNDLQTETSGHPSGLKLYERGFRSGVIVPLYSQQSCIGAFMLLSVVPHFFTEEHLQIAQEVGSQLAIVLNQQQLDEQLKQHTEQLEQRVEERTKEIGRLSALHHAILKYAGQAITSTDINGVIQTANQAAENLLGYRVDELIGRVPQVYPGLPDNPGPFISYELNEDNNAPSNLFLNGMANQDYLSLECMAVGKDGRQIPILLVTTALKDENGTIIGYVGIATDISALKAAETQLKSLNQRFQLATEAVGQGIWEDDLVQNKLIWDDRCWEILGIPPQTDWSFDEFKKMIHPDDLAAFLEGSHLKSKDHKLWNVSRVIRPDGKIIYVEHTAMIVTNHQDIPVRVIGVLWDVTHRKLAEDALRESEQRFREIADNIDEVFWIHSAASFQLLYVNPAYERIWNRSCQSLYDNPFSFMDTILEEDLPAVRDFFTAYKSGTEGQMDFRIQDFNGSLRWLSARTFVVRDEIGKDTRYIGIVNDVTSQKEKELVLQQSLQREQELNQLKSQFVSIASHEFRTPMTTIQSSVDLIRLYRERPSATASTAIQTHLEVIEKEVEKFNELLTDILTIGKVEAGRINFNPRQVDIITLCETIISTHFHQQSDNQTVHVLVEGTPYIAYLDDKLMNHVIVNLISNAFKFSKEAPTLRIVFEEYRLILQVIDTGMGIPAKDIPMLFQAFYRASNTTGIQGTGLGLVISRQFVELHGGCLEVQSKINQGTTFTITLPVDSHRMNKA